MNTALLTSDVEKYQTDHDNKREVYRTAFTLDFDSPSKDNKRAATAARVAMNKAKANLETAKKALRDAESDKPGRSQANQHQLAETRVKALAATVDRATRKGMILGLTSKAIGNGILSLRVLLKAAETTYIAREALDNAEIDNNIAYTRAMDAPDNSALQEVAGKMAEALATAKDRVETAEASERELARDTVV